MSVVLHPPSWKFPSGTLVEAYPTAQRGPTYPVGQESESATVTAGGTLTFTTLNEGEAYVAYALVAGEHRYMEFGVDVSTADEDVADLRADLDAGLDGVASVEELTAQVFWTGVLDEATYPTGRSFPVFVAPFACRIMEASVASWQQGIIAAHDTNYWIVAVNRYRSGVPAAIATKTTKVTGGEAVTVRIDWNFDTQTFHATNKVLAKGDIVGFAFTFAGTPAAAWENIICQVRYEPV